MMTVMMKVVLVVAAPDVFVFVVDDDHGGFCC